MSEFRSYTDRDGNKVVIGDWIEVGFNLDQKVDKTGKVARITNKTFSGITVNLEGNRSEHIPAKRTRKLNQS